MAGIPDFDQYFEQFQSVVTLESLPAVCVVGLNPACPVGQFDGEPGTDQFIIFGVFVSLWQIFFLSPPRHKGTKKKQYLTFVFSFHNSQRLGHKCTKKV